MNKRSGSSRIFPALRIYAVARTKDGPHSRERRGVRADPRRCPVEKRIRTSSRILDEGKPESLSLLFADVRRRHPAG
jgi:hypothetical protein